MPKTRLSLYYPISYLLFSGIFLMIAPRLALKLLLSNGDYGEVMPRLAGVLMVGLGFIVLQIVRHEVEVRYPSLVGAGVLPALLAGAVRVLAPSPVCDAVPGSRVRLRVDPGFDAARTIYLKP